METLVSIIGLVLSIVAFVCSLRASKKADGVIELNIRNMISESKRYYTSSLHDWVLAKADETISKDEELMRTVDQNVKIAKQDFCNAYEEACMKYIDKKVDKERFKKTYQVEIRQLVANWRDIIFAGTSSYAAIRKVDEEWNNPEKS
jgi:hypothetical protein